MSNVEITPDILRAVADEAGRLGVLDMAERGVLHAWARDLEREQAEEKRIDELAEAFTDGLRTVDTTFHLCRHLNERNQDAYRAGIRAVLAKLDEKKADVEVKPVGWYRSMELGFAHKHFGFPPWGGGRVTASDGGVWEWDEAGQCWELREYGSPSGAES